MVHNCAVKFILFGVFFYELKSEKSGNNWFSALPSNYLLETL